MFITVNNLKKTLGKYVEFTDLYIGVPCLIVFIVLFSIPFTRIFSLMFLSVVLFLLIPVRLSKKNRMYKVMALVFKYIFKSKEFIYKKEEVNDFENIERRKIFISPRAVDHINGIDAAFGRKIIVYIFFRRRDESRLYRLISRMNVR